MRIKVHPIQQDYTITGGVQACGLCGAEERWTATAQPAVAADVKRRAVHLVHLVRAHLADVQASLSPRERGREVTIEAGEV